MRAKSLCWVFLGGFLLLANYGVAFAQERTTVKPGGRPTEKPLPTLKEQEIVPVPQLIAPPPPLAEGAERESLGPKVYVNKIVITGNTVFSAEELDRITEPYTNRELTTEDIDALRQVLTVYYINNGYINSGAIIPDQKVDSGIIEVHIIEGSLTSVDVEGNKWFVDGFIEDRVALGPDVPLNITSLQKRLQLLQQNSLIERLNSTLKPGVAPGESVLNVQIEEQSPYLLQLGFDNYQSPSVGAEEGWAIITHRNFTGHGDSLSLGYGASEGAEPQLDASYWLPITANDITLNVRYQKNDFKVVHEPFEELDVKSKSDIYTIGVTWPVFRSLTETFSLTFEGERLSHKTYLLGEPFSFTPGVEDGKAVVTALRLSQDWAHYTQKEVIAFRSQFSFGIDALGATTNSGEIPDGRFVSWLGQFQWAKLLSPKNVQLILRADLQLANNSLLPVEQIAVGGRYSVRGYRENQLVRDQGIITSLEARIPLVQNVWWADYLQLAPFVDYGRGWNEDLDTPPVKSIASVGLGLRWAASWKTTTRTINPQFEIYWGVPLKDVDSPDYYDLQDDGIHLQLVIAGF